jgi:hypothetical protein
LPFAFVFLLLLLVVVHPSPQPEDLLPPFPLSLSSRRSKKNKSEAPDSKTFILAVIFLLRFQPRNRMSSPGSI